METCFLLNMLFAETFFNSQKLVEASNTARKVPLVPTECLITEIENRFSAPESLLRERILPGQNYSIEVRKDHINLRRLRTWGCFKCK